MAKCVISGRCVLLWSVKELEGRRGLCHAAGRMSQRWLSQSSQSALCSWVKLKIVAGPERIRHIITTWAGHAEGPQETIGRGTIVWMSAPTFIKMGKFLKIPWASGLLLINIFLKWYVLYQGCEATVVIKPDNRWDFHFETRDWFYIKCSINKT